MFNIYVKLLLEKLKLLSITRILFFIETRDISLFTFTELLDESNKINWYVQASTSPGTLFINLKEIFAFTSINLFFKFESLISIRPGLYL